MHQAMARRAARGVTLIELLVAITVLAILASLAVPSFRDSTLPSQLRSVANEMVGATQLARSESIKRNTVVTLCVSADGSTCATGGWEKGWIVTAVVGGTTTVLHHEAAAPSGYHVTASGGSTTLAFQPTGVDASPETFTVCRATPSAGAQERVVSVTATGRASVRTTTTGLCP